MIQSKSDSLFYLISETAMFSMNRRTVKYTKYQKYRKFVVDLPLAVRTKLCKSRCALKSDTTYIFLSNRRNLSIVLCTAPLLAARCRCRWCARYIPRYLVHVVISRTYHLFSKHSIKFKNVVSSCSHSSLVFLKFQTCL